MPSPTYRTIKTPVASERSLLVIVEDSVIGENPDILPPEGTLYGQIDPRIMPADLSSTWNNYRYVDQDDLGDGKLGLLFVKVQTQQEQQTPYRTTTSFGDHRWPPILHALVFIQDNNFPRSTNGSRGGQAAIISGPSYYVREVYTPEIYEGTTFVQEEYFSDVPFNIPFHPVPVPTAVSYDLPGVRGSFQECLHPDIIIPNAQTASSYSVAGQAFNANGALQGQKFPRTNFTTWAPYVLSDKQWFENGYRRTLIRVYPPGLPKIIIR